MRKISTRQKRRRTALLTAVLVPLLILTAGWFFSLTDLGRALEWKTVDLRFRTRGKLAPDPSVVIIALDEKTFSDLKLKYPFPPVLYAKLIQTLRDSGASVVAFDLLYSEPTRECDPPDQDRLLAEEIKEAGGVVWAMALNNGTVPMEPIPAIRKAAEGIGFINLPDESDGRIRRYIAERAGRKSLAASVIEAHAGFLPPSAKGEKLRVINYSGRTGTFPVFSLSDVLSGKIPEERIKDKICLVGPTFTASHDRFATPFHDPTLPNMPGVEIHANIIGTMLSGRPLAPFPAKIPAIVLVLFAAALSLLIYYERPWIAVVAWLAGSSVWAMWAMREFLADRLLPVAVPLMVPAAIIVVGFFVSYLNERKRRRSIRNLFSHYVDPSAVNWLLRNPDSLQPKGERRVVTILDTDIEGFTSITERLDPAVLISMLNEYFEAISDAAISAGGMHDKYAGDALMVIFGFPLKQEDHALRALSAAREMLRRVEELNVSFGKRGLPVLNTRVGICSGEVVIGSVGGTKRKAFTAMGDAANMASRMESLNKRFGTRVMLSESTAALLPKDIPLRDLGEVKVRGISHPVRVFNPAFDESSARKDQAEQSEQPASPQS